MPQRLTQDVPRGAELLAVSVTTLLPVVVGFGLKVAVTPAGSPGAVRVTEPGVVPPSGTAVTVAVAEPPSAIVQGMGEMTRKIPGGRGSRAMEVVSISAPEVPVMITMALSQDWVELLTVSVSTLVPVVGFPVQDAVTPLGSADVTARFTLPVNPA